MTQQISEFKQNLVTVIYLFISLTEMDEFEDEELTENVEMKDARPWGRRRSSRRRRWIPKVINIAEKLLCPSQCQKCAGNNSLKCILIKKRCSC